MLGSFIAESRIRELRPVEVYDDAEDESSGVHLLPGAWPMAAGAG
jgi:hypothetical protein